MQDAPAGKAEALAIKRWFRHSAASHLAMSGAEAPQIMAAMRHRSLSTVQRYIHFAKSAKQALAERTASVALAGMAASQGKVAEVVGLKGGRK